MKKLRIVAMVLAGMTAMSLFSGCEKNSNHGLDPENPVTITVWHYYSGIQQNFFDEMVNEFNETTGAENGIIVEAYTKSSINELAESVIASFNGDAGAEEVPDIFASYSETAFVIKNMGKTVDLNQYFTDAEKSEYIDGYIEEGQFSEDGKLTIFPVAKSTEIMMINKTDWDKFAESAGVSEDDLKTWEGVAQTAEKYYEYTDALTPDVENDGKVFFGRDSIANYMNIGAKQLGTELYTANGQKGEISADKEVLRKLWDNYYVPYVKGHYRLKGKYASDDIKTGNIISCVCSTTGAAYFPDSVTINDEHTYPIDTLILPVPNFEGYENHVVQQGAGMVVSKSEEVSEYASVVFLKWFTEAQRNIRFSVEAGYLPVVKEANNIEMIDNTIEEYGIEISDMLYESTRTAIECIDNSVLYASAPFENAAEARDFIGNFINDSAFSVYEEAQQRIQSGESYDDVIQEYISDEAFESWYSEFSTGLADIMG